MKIVLFGADGSLGTQLISVFEGHDIIANTKNDVDITDRDAVIDHITREKPDVILNATAYNNVDACESAEEFEIAKKVNVLQ